MVSGSGDRQGYIDRESARKHDKIKQSWSDSWFEVQEFR